MHAVSFKLKRGYHRALAHARPLLRAVHDAMTPARFDMMHALVQDGRALGPIAQSALPGTLGVSRVTVSRMLKRLVEIGFVERLPRPPRTRAIYLRLTPLGLAILRRVKHVVWRRRLLDTLYEDVYDYLSSRRRRMAVFDLFSSLEHLAWGLGDKTSIHYPTLLPTD